MQHKAGLNYPRLISPEVSLGCKYRRLRQVKGTVFMDNVSFTQLL